ETDRAAGRATVVLNEMEEAGVITAEQQAAAVLEPVRVSRTLATQHAQYFIDWLDSEIRTLVGEPTEDMVVETTLDLTLQTAAERNVRAILERDGGRGVEQAALVAVDGDGRVRALIGGASYADSQFNRAVDARRQAGSAWKPFVCRAALEAGYRPQTPVVDEPVRIGNWSPQNYSQRYSGAMSLQQAVAQSINTVAGSVADRVGRDAVARAARRVGITSRVGLEPAMARGAVEVSPLEMAGAYPAFANGGKRAPPRGIARIRPPDGRVIYQRAESERRGDQAIQNPPLFYLNQMPRAVIDSGTGRSADIAGYDLAGKTGTTSDYRDAWFVGYTGGFVTAVWVGKDDNSPMRGVTGGQAPAAIWKGFMQAALPRLNVQTIPNGPPAPEGWMPADPLGDLMSGLGDLFGGAEPDPLAEPAPTETRPGGSAPQTQPQPQPPAAEPKPAPPAQQPEPAQPADQRPDPLFF